MFVKYFKKARQTVVSFLDFVGPGTIIGVAIVEVIYWTSPACAQAVHFPTRAGDLARAEAEHGEHFNAGKAATSGMPVAVTDLPEWTPARVEANYDSGFTVVSLLGSHCNFQLIVRDLKIPTGSTFRIYRGTPQLIVGG